MVPRHPLHLIGGLIVITGLGEYPSSGTESSGAPAVFEIRACRGSDGRALREFRVAITDVAAVRQATALTGGSGGPIVFGRVIAGNGGFNTASWHLEPTTVQLVEVAIEACDACPSHLESHRSAFERLGPYCPWSPEVVRRVR
jgi:hypothetical protein